MVEVRRARPDDAAQIAVINVRAWRVAYRGLMPDETLDSLSVGRREELWKGLAAAGNPTIYVALLEERVVGYCAVAMPSRDADAEVDVAEVGAIYVDPDFWRRGIGRALMDATYTDLRVGPWRWVTLWVFAANQAARDFYTRFGLVPDGAEVIHAKSGATQVRLRGPVG